jgi:hypothetical protein
MDEAGIASSTIDIAGNQLLHASGLHCGIQMFCQISCMLMLP